MEHRLKYYHIEHKEAWKCVSEEQIPANAKYESVLYVRYRAEDIEVSGEDQEYWGPMYIDIDSTNIAEALADMREIITYMDLNFNLPEADYHVYASGGKGFHLEINPYVFMDAKFKLGLPLRYRGMAARIKQDIGEHLNIDMGVYSQGKGRQWRKVNVQRENGNYKRLLSRAEFDAVTAAQVLEIVKQPGLPVQPFTKHKPNDLFKSWFDSTKGLVDLAKPSAPVPVETLAKNETPACVVALANNSRVRGSVNSNLLTMQAISYGLAKEWDIDTVVNYNRKFINEYRSTQYKTPALFESHFRGLYDYALVAPQKFKFGCKMMLSCVDGIDCSACPIKLGDGVEEASGRIVIKDKTYYIMAEDPDLPPRQLSNFVADLKSVTTRESFYDMQVPVMEMDLISDLGITTRLVQPVDLFASKSSFTRALGLDHSYYGSDKDLQMLKLAIMHFSNHKNITEIDYTGLKWLKDEWHFVTKEGSMSLNNTIDLVKTHLSASEASRTQLNFDPDDVPHEPEIIAFFDTVVDINAPEVIIPLTTWFFSAFFSPHCMEMNEPAPSLFVTGMHGSGKTQTMLQLHRLFAPKRPSFPSISSTTAFSMNKFCSSTNLMPLIFDEFKPTANAGRYNEEGQVSQAIRASYNKGFESRGTKNRTVEETAFLAPLAIIGEQQINEGAVQERIIQVHMDKSSHTASNYDKLEQLKRLKVEAIGAHFLEYVMRIRAEEYVDTVLRYDKILDETHKGLFENRPRRNLASLLATAEYIEQYLLLYTGDEKLVEKFSSRVDAYKASFEAESSQVYNEVRSLDDIAQILIQLNEMADLMDSTLGDNVLMRQRHYIVKNNILYLDLVACYKLLNAYVKRMHINLYLTDRLSFISQLNQKDYVVVKTSKTDVIVANKPRLVVGIDLTLANGFNIVLDNFRGEQA